MLQCSLYAIKLEHEQGHTAHRSVCWMGETTNCRSIQLRGGHPWKSRCTVPASCGQAASKQMFRLPLPPSFQRVTTKQLMSRMKGSGRTAMPRELRKIPEGQNHLGEASAPMDLAYAKVGTRFKVQVRPGSCLLMHFVLFEGFKVIDKCSNLDTPPHLTYLFMV
jgi:hypothetical protein